MKHEVARVLLIEDNPHYAGAVADLLAAIGAPFAFETSGSLAGGIEVLARGGVDLVMLDLELPDSRGLETFARVQAQDARVPIIVLTAQDDEEIALEAVNSGAQDYLVKTEIDGQLLKRSMRYAIERQRSESALRESQRLIQEIADSTPEIISLFDLTSERIVYVNAQLTNLLGYAPRELRSFDPREIVHPDDRLLLNQDLRRLRAIPGAGSTAVTYRVKHANGEWRWLRSENLIFTRNPEGRPRQILSTTQDITERKLAEEALQESERRLREQAALLDCAQDAIIVRDLTGRILFWNRSAERIFGWSAAEVIGRNLHDPDLAVLAAQNLPAEHKVLTDGEWTGELRQKTKDEREIIVESRWTLVRDEAGQAKSILVINTDITEKKRLEAQFLRMQRLDSIGALASGIAHDLNNSLAPILMALHTLQQRFTDANSRRWLTLIRRSTERSRDLIEKVLTFAKGAEGERLPLQPAQLVGDLAKILSETLPKNISLTVDLADDLWNILGDTTQIHQILMNLCINGRDAMPHGGKLSIRVSNLTLIEKQHWMVNEVAPGRFVRIAVSDTGVGMQPELIDRAFEPFFTTKPPGQGSGLGLSTASGIVRSHGGFITVNSAVGRGSQFIVHLPAGEERAGEDIPVHQSESSERFSGISGIGAIDRIGQNGHSSRTGRNELILVVEDEMELREITRATLEANGYRTLGVEDGRHALALYREHSREITVVLIDLGMPNLDGLEMSRALQAINPKVKIIGASGLHDSERIQDATRSGVMAVLNKPYTAPQLLSALAESIDRE